MKSLSESLFFQMMDKSRGGEVRRQITSISSPVNVLPMDKLNYQIDIIKRRFNYNFKNMILKDLADGTVVPVFNVDNIKLNQAIPVVGLMDGGVAKSFVNLTEFGRYNKQGEFDIDTRKLYALLQTGSLLRVIGSQYWNRITMTPAILRNACIIYSRLFSKVIDKMFAINLNRQRSDMVHFLCAKFFLINMMENKISTIDNIAYNACNNNTSKDVVFDSDINFTEDAYENIDNFIENLQKNVDGLGGLTKREFVNNWMTMYSFNTILALDYFPFFLHMVFSAILNSHLNKEYLIEPLIGREANLLYNDLSSIVR
jgi:hypothetical protein